MTTIEISSPLQDTGSADKALSSHGSSGSAYCASGPTPTPGATPAGQAPWELVSERERRSSSVLRLQHEDTVVSGSGSISGTRRASTAQHTESGATDTGMCSIGTCCMGFWFVVHCGLLGSVLWCAVTAYSAVVLGAAIAGTAVISVLTAAVYCSHCTLGFVTLAGWNWLSSDRVAYLNTMRCCPPPATRGCGGSLSCILTCLAITGYLLLALLVPAAAAALVLGGVGYGANAVLGSESSMTLAEQALMLSCAFFSFAPFLLTRPAVAVLAARHREGEHPMGLELSRAAKVAGEPMTVGPLGAVMFWMVWLAGAMHRTGRCVRVPLALLALLLGTAMEVVLLLAPAASVVQMLYVSDVRLGICDTLALACDGSLTFASPDGLLQISILTLIFSTPMKPLFTMLVWIAGETPSLRSLQLALTGHPDASCYSRAQPCAWYSPLLVLMDVLTWGKVTLVLFTVFSACTGLIPIISWGLNVRDMQVSVDAVEALWPAALGLPLLLSIRSCIPICCSACKDCRGGGGCWAFGTRRAAGTEEGAARESRPSSISGLAAQSAHIASPGWLAADLIRRLSGAESTESTGACLVQALSPLGVSAALGSADAETDLEALAGGQMDMPRTAAHRKELAAHPQELLPKKLREQGAEVKPMRGEWCCRFKCRYLLHHCCGCPARPSAVYILEWAQSVEANTLQGSRGLTRLVRASGWFAMLTAMHADTLAAGAVDVAASGMQEDSHCSLGDSGAAAGEQGSASGSGSRKTATGSRPARGTAQGQTSSARIDELPLVEAAELRSASREAPQEARSACIRLGVVPSSLPLISAGTLLLLTVFLGPAFRLNGLTFNPLLRPAVAAANETLPSPRSWYGARVADEDAELPVSQLWWNSFLYASLLLWALILFAPGDILHAQYVAALAKVLLHPLALQRLLRKSQHQHGKHGLSIGATRIVARLQVVFHSARGWLGSFGGSLMIGSAVSLLLYGACVLFIVLFTHKHASSDLSVVTWVSVPSLWQAGITMLALAVLSLYPMFLLLRVDSAINRALDAVGKTLARQAQRPFMEALLDQVHLRGYLPGVSVTAPSPSGTRQGAAVQAWRRDLKRFARQVGSATERRAVKELVMGQAGKDAVRSHVKQALGGAAGVTALLHQRPQAASVSIDDSDVDGVDEDVIPASYLFEQSTPLTDGSEEGGAASTQSAPQTSLPEDPRWADLNAAQAILGQWGTHYKGLAVSLFVEVPDMPSLPRLRLFISWTLVYAQLLSLGASLLATLLFRSF